MKKLLATVSLWTMLLAMVSPVAEARVLVLDGSDSDIASVVDTNNDQALTESMHDIPQFVVSILRSYGLRQGTDYDVVRIRNRNLKTLDLRYGRVVYNNDGPNPRVVQYDAIIIAAHDRRGVVNSATGVRLDSLSRFQNGNNYNRVPIAAIWYGSGGANSTGDSTYYGGDNTQLATIGQTNFASKDPTIRFQTAVAKYAINITSGTPTAGKTRILIGAGGNAALLTSSATSLFSHPTVPCKWCDSLVSSPQANVDTAIVWVRYFDHIAGAKPFVYAQSNDYASVATNIPAVWTTLAFLDSLSGGGVFGTAEPVSFGIMVPGLASRGKAVGYPSSTCGMVNGDSTNTYAFVDSLASLGAPISFGAPTNLDSITAYKRDIQRVMDKSNNFRLFPFQRFGMDTAAAGLGNTSLHRPADLFGAWRNRSAIGDGSFVGADSSLYSHLLFGFSRLDSLYRNRVDHALYAPLDDWSPKNLSAIGSDSIYSAIALSGAKAIVTNYNIWNAQSGKQQTLLQGLDYHNRSITTLCGNAYGRKINVLGTAVLDSGSARFDNGYGQGSCCSGGIQNHERVSRFWLSFIGYRPVQSWAYNAGTTPYTRDSTFTPQRVAVVPFASLGSGNRADASTSPLAPGWWYVKWIVNGAKTVNLYGRRTLINIVPVEKVTP